MQGVLYMAYNGPALLDVREFPVIHYHPLQEPTRIYTFVIKPPKNPHVL
jgi:hypothetical protein